MAGGRRPYDCARLDLSNRRHAAGFDPCGHADAAGALSRHPRESRAVDAGGAHSGQARARDAQARLRRHRTCRQDRRGRGDEERAWPGSSAPRRHGRASGQGADRPFLRLEDYGQASRRHRHAGDARVRPRHPCRDVARHCATAGGDEEPMVRHAGHDPAARRRARHRRAGDARRWAVHALSEARLPCRLPR